MKTKICTDIEQSKKLAEILPIESADMFYRDNGIDVKLMWEHNTQKVKYPCWSLAALLELLPYEIVLDEDESLILGIHKEDIQYFISYDNTYNGEVYFETLLYNDFVDACVEMIELLHKKKLI